MGAQGEMQGEIRGQAWSVRVLVYLFLFCSSRSCLKSQAPALREDRPSGRGWTARACSGRLPPAFARARGSLGAITEPLYRHGNFADHIGYRLTAWRQDEAEISRGSGLVIGHFTASATGSLDPHH